MQKKPDPTAMHWQPISELAPVPDRQWCIFRHDQGGRITPFSAPADWGRASPMLPFFTHFALITEPLS